jgi:hypothetical protein
MLFSNTFTVTTEDYEFCLDLMKTRSEFFSLNLNGRDPMNVLDEHKIKMSTHIYKNDVCVYLYSFFNKPCYIGMTTNGHVNRFYKQIRALYDREYNKKNPEKLLWKNNIREPWIERFHRLNWNAEALSLQILCLEKNNVGSDNYARLLDLAEHHHASIGFFEQTLINYYCTNGLDDSLLNVNSPSKVSWYTMRSKSQFVEDLIAQMNKDAFSEFLA